jgi:hypothetical protein
MKRRFHGWFIVGVMALLVQVGCASWYSDLNQPAESKIKAARTIPPGHVSLQAVFLRLEPEESVILDAMWPSLDEISLDFALRQRLELNGIRCGAIHGEVPPEMQQWIDRTTKTISDDPMESLGMNADVSSYTQTMYFKSGLEKELLIKPMRTGNLVVMHHESGGGGKTYIDPALQLKLETELRDDGTIRLNIEPVIEHGEYKNQIVSEDFGMRREIKRDKHYWRDLQIVRDLSAKEYIVLSCTNPARAIGKHFFQTNLRDGSDARLVLLIRIDKSNTDSAFAINDHP